MRDSGALGGCHACLAKVPEAARSGDSCYGQLLARHRSPAMDRARQGGDAWDEAGAHLVGAFAARAADGAR